ncbi:hypothetical protein [Chryseobacterium sp. A301]
MRNTLLVFFEDDVGIDNFVGKCRMNPILHFKMEFLALLSKGIQLHKQFAPDQGRVAALEKIQSEVEKWDLSRQAQKVRELQCAWDELSFCDANSILSVHAQKEFTRLESHIKLLFSNLNSPQGAPQSNSSPVCYLGSSEIRKKY